MMQLSHGINRCNGLAFFHSYLRLFTGLAKAALIACALTVKSAITGANSHYEISMR